VVAFALATSYRDFVLASICFGVGGGVCMPALMALAARKGSGADAMASVMALMTIAHSAGMLVGAVLGGVAMQLWSLHWVFLIGGFAMAVGTLQYLCVGSEVEVSDAEAPPAPHRLAAGAGSPS
jgi:MFS family permease